ncbi:hypothetical protein EE612_055157 [Oryza sativa]|nr:hypothetical protein EE612_055157 [Oryza sativa]
MAREAASLHHPPLSPLQSPPPPSYHHPSARGARTSSLWAPRRSDPCATGHSRFATTSSAIALPPHSSTSHRRLDLRSAEGPSGPVPPHTATSAT